MAAWEIQRLNRTHDRSAFDCGQQSLNEWLKLRAGQYDRKDLARTFVATHRGLPHIGGYYAISSHHIPLDLLPPAATKGLPRIDVPVVLLGRLAVAQSAQGKGVGSLLLIDALRRTADISQQIGIRGMEVDAIDEAAKQFYGKFGFRELLDDPRHLVISITEIRKLTSGSPP